MNLNNNCLDCSLIKTINPKYPCEQSEQDSCPAVLECHQSLIWEGCYKCDSMESGARCETCNNGHKSDGNGGCVSCSSDEFCCGNTTSPTRIDNCDECDESGNGCGKCASGYYIDDSTGSCVKCDEHTCCPGNTHNQPSASGCLECSNDQMRCVSCIENTTLKGDGKSCVPCSSDECCGSGNRGSIGEHCDSCTSDMSECSTCQSGYKLISGTCVSCGLNECCFRGNNGDVISNCYSCSSDLRSCLGCVQGMKLNGNSCVSCSSDECCPDNTTIPITSNCSECYDNETGCVKCKTGYSNSGGICTKISESGGNGGVSGGVIVGVVIGVIVIVGIIIFIIIYFIIRPNNKDKNKNDETIEMNGLEIFDEIGHGATSVVYKGRYNGKDVAVKIMKQDGGGFEKELELMMKLKNPYIIEVYDKCVVSGHSGYVMEYVGLGSLDVVMSQQVFSDGLKMRYGREICLGMRYLHSMNIIHRDLKLENILVMSTSESETSAICKISDFGTARETDISSTISMTQSMTMTSNIGTPLYMAPEILSGQSHYSMKADIYSYGIVLCGLWNQQIPYSDESFSNVTEFLTRITNQEHRPSLKPDCPQPYIQLVSACLQSDPHSRPSFDEISKTVFGVN